MTTNALATARVEQSVKDAAATVLREAGLTVSDAIRLLLTKIAKEHAVPLAMITPNAKTIRAINEARSGSLESFEDIDSLMADLNT